jgi:hypothetical protein
VREHGRVTANKALQSPVRWRNQRWQSAEDRKQTPCFAPDFCTARTLLKSAFMSSEDMERRAQSLRDARGQVFVEYLVLVVVTGVALVMLVGPVVGPRIVNEYAKRRALLYATYP